MATKRSNDYAHTPKANRLLRQDKDAAVDLIRKKNEAMQSAVDDMTEIANELETGPRLSKRLRAIARKLQLECNRTSPGTTPAGTPDSDDE